MGLFHATGEAKDRLFQPMAPQKFAEQHKEEHIQAWVDSSPAVLNDGQPMLSLGREIVTDHNSYIDNLYLDGNGVLVAAEMKRGRTPRDVLAQISEYAAYISKLDWNKIESFCQKRNNQPLDVTYRSVFGRSLLRTPKPEHRLMIVAEEFRPEIVETAAYHIERGMPLALLQFRYYAIDGQSVLDVRTIMGEIPEQQAPTPTVPNGASALPVARTMSDDGYSNWILSSFDGFLTTLAQTKGWALVTRQNKQSYLFTLEAWNTPLANLHLQADTFISTSIALRIVFRTSALPELRNYIERHRPDWRERYAAEFEAPTYPTPNTTLTLKLPRPTLGDQPALKQVEAKLNDMASTLIPLLDAFFANRPIQNGSA